MSGTLSQKPRRVQPTVLRTLEEAKRIEALQSGAGGDYLRLG